jgi:hypothetical protein
MADSQNRLGAGMLLEGSIGSKWRHPTAVAMGEAIVIYRKYPNVAVLPPWLMYLSSYVD